MDKTNVSNTTKVRKQKPVSADVPNPPHVVNVTPESTTQRQYVDAMRRTPRRHSVGGRSRRSGKTHSSSTSSSVGRRLSEYDDYTVTSANRSVRNNDEIPVTKTNNNAAISKGWTFEGNIQTSNLIFIGDPDKILFNERRCTSMGKNLNEFMNKTQAHAHPIQIFGEGDLATVGFGGGPRQLKLFAKYAADGSCMEIRLCSQ